MRFLIALDEFYGLNKLHLVISMILAMNMQPNMGMFGGPWAKTKIKTAEKNIVSG